jgi:hypothetical protein
VLGHHFAPPSRLHRLPTGLQQVRQPSGGFQHRPDGAARPFLSGFCYWLCNSSAPAGAARPGRGLLRWLRSAAVAELSRSLDARVGKMAASVRRPRWQSAVVLPAGAAPCACWRNLAPAVPLSGALSLQPRGRAGAFLCSHSGRDCWLASRALMQPLSCWSRVNSAVLCLWCSGPEVPES